MLIGMKSEHDLTDTPHDAHGGYDAHERGTSATSAPASSLPHAPTDRRSLVVCGKRPLACKFLWRFFMLGFYNQTHT